MHKVWSSIGQIWPLGIPVAQSWADIGALLKIIHDQRIVFVFEVGVHRGGLTALLLARHGLDYAGVEIDPAIVDPRIPKASYRVDDAWAPATLDWAGGLIAQAAGPAFVLCDGGNKKRDLAAYAPLLRRGDWIATHDYGDEIVRDDVEPPPAWLQAYRPDWLTDTNWYVLRCV